MSLENTMDPDELADAFRNLFDQAHAHEGLLDNRGRRLLRLMHAAAEAFKDHCVEGGIIQPQSGGDPKPPGP